MIQPARRRTVNDSLIARNFRDGDRSGGLGSLIGPNAAGERRFVQRNRFSDGPSEKVGFSPTPGGDFPLRDKHVTYLSGVAVEG